MVSVPQFDPSHSSRVRHRNEFGPQPDPSARRRLWANRAVSMTIGLVMLAVIGMVAGQLHHHASSAVRQLSGSFTLWHATPQSDPCTDPASIPWSGRRVEVRDGAARVLGHSQLSSGKAEVNRRGCVFRFAVPSVPHSANYAVAIGNEVALPYEAGDLDRANWNVALNLGAQP